MHTATAASTGAPLAADNAARFDLYAFIHKALRSLMADTLCRLGRLDVTDADEMAATLGQVGTMLELLRLHVEKENRYVHPAIEARQPGQSRRIGEEHDDHLESLAALAAELQGLQAAAPARRPMLALRLYRHLGLFVAENLQHMHIEDTSHNQALWESYSDAELIEIHESIVKGIEPQQFALVLRWMAAALTPQELLTVLAPMQQAMPPQAFEACADVVRGTLTQPRWAKVARALGLPVAPGLSA